MLYILLCSINYILNTLHITCTLWQIYIFDHYLQNFSDLASANSATMPFIKPSRAVTDGDGSARNIKLFICPGHCQAPGACMKYSLN